MLYKGYDITENPLISTVIKISLNSEPWGFMAEATLRDHRIKSLLHWVRKCKPREALAQSQESSFSAELKSKPQPSTQQSNPRHQWKAELLHKITSDKEGFAKPLPPGYMPKSFTFLSYLPTEFLYNSITIN